jgi:hypothetical protein
MTPTARAYLAELARRLEDPQLLAGLARPPT